MNFSYFPRDGKQFYFDEFPCWKVFSLASIYRRLQGFLQPNLGPDVVDTQQLVETKGAVILRDWRRT